MSEKQDFTVRMKATGVVQDEKKSWTVRFAGVDHAGTIRTIRKEVPASTEAEAKEMMTLYKGALVVAYTFDADKVWKVGDKEGVGAYRIAAVTYEVPED